MQRHVRQIDVQTGEVLEAGVMVYLPQRPKIAEGWVMSFQDAFIKLAMDRTIKGEQMRVLLYLIGKLDFENWIHVPQAEIAEVLGMTAPQVSRAIASLTAKGLLTKGPKLGRVTTLQLSLNVGWKGRVKSLQDARRRHLAVVKR
jgi:DNA-binding transcriptional ArsR family regulator